MVHIDIYQLLLNLMIFQWLFHRIFRFFSGVVHKSEALRPHFCSFMRAAIWDRASLMLQKGGLGFSRQFCCWNLCNKYFLMTFPDFHWLFTDRCPFSRPISNSQVKFKDFSRCVWTLVMTLLTQSGSDLYAELLVVVLYSFYCISELTESDANRQHFMNTVKPQ